MVIFFNSQGIIHKEFVPPGQMVNKEYYVEVLSRLFHRIRRVRPQFQERGSWFLLQDNLKTSHHSINKAVFGKTRDSTIKSCPIFS
jgi:hypothetical protein